MRRVANYIGVGPVVCMTGDIRGLYMSLKWAGGPNEWVVRSDVPHICGKIQGKHTNVGYD